MATPYVMSKVPTCYYPCDAETDLPECCKEASSKPRYAYWCSACKVEPGGGGHHGTAAARRRRSLSETAEPADPLREQNHRADHWKRPVKEYGDGALHGGCAAYQPSLRPYDTEYVEEALPGEAGRVGAGACPSKRPKERLLPLPFCSMATDYEPEVVTTPGASAAVASAAGGNHHHPHPHPHHAPAPAPRRLEVCAQTLLIEGPYSATRAAPPHAHPPGQPTPQQQLVGRRRALSRSPTLSENGSPPSSPSPPCSLQAHKGSVGGGGGGAARCLPQGGKRLAGGGCGGGGRAGGGREPSPQKRGCPDAGAAAALVAVRGSVARLQAAVAASAGTAAGGRRRSASHSPENHHSPPPPAARPAWDASPPPRNCPCPAAPDGDHARRPGPGPGPQPACCAGDKYRCVAVVRPSFCGDPAAGAGACGGRRSGGGCERSSPPRGKRRSSSRSPLSGKASHAPAAAASAPAVHHQRSLSPPACLSAGHAAATAAAAAAKAAHHHQPQQHARPRPRAPAPAPAPALPPAPAPPPAPPPDQPPGAGEPQHNALSHSRLQQHQQQLPRYTPEVEALRSRLRELRGAVPAGGNSTGVGGVSSTLSEGKRLRQRSESDPGHGCLSSAAVAAAADAVRRLQQVVASTTGHANVMSAAARALVSPNGPGGVCAATTCDSREAKRARDASPVPPEPPPITLEKHRPVVAHNPTRIAHCRAFHKTKGASRVLRRGDSSESDYDDQTPDSGAVVDCKDVPQEDSEEDDTRSVMSSLTAASSSDSASPSLVGETLGSISLSDTGLSSRITTPHAPIKPVTPPRPPMAASSFIVRRKGDLPRSLRSSLFSHVPPFIRFSMHDAKGEPLPPEVSSILKWKLSTITPVVVRRTLVNSGFRLVRSECSYTESNEWSGTWGKHMKSLCFRTLKEFQKINHFPGTFQIGRKDRLWKNLYRLMTKFGRKEFGFIPRTYVLPQDSKLLRQAWEKNCGKEKWIIKPPASARGTGIKVIHRWAQIPKKRPLVVQKYIADPYLINGSKFDLRLYVLVTSMNPMRVYIYDDGLVRFASVKYSGDMATLSDRYMHLTNYSINKLSSMYTQNEDASACQGHKWTVKTLWSYMEKLGVDVNRLWDNLVDLCIKTVISGEPSISQLTRSNLPSRYCSYELFGIDVLLDEHLKPWLLEVNISPSLHSASPLDLAVKGPLVRDLMNLAGYHVPNKLVTSQVEELLTQFGVPRDRISSLCFDRRLYTTLLGPEERQKHHMFQAYTEREEYLADILEKLTPDDVRHLIQAEDELTQAGRFIRIFPTPDTHLYLEYFESPSYYNRLFDAWETKYHMNRQEGIERLEYLCRKKHHLNVPPVNATAKFSVSQQVLPAEEGMDDMGLGLEKTSTEDMTTTTERLKYWAGPASATQRPCRRMFATALMGYLGLSETGLSPEQPLPLDDGLRVIREKLLSPRWRTRVEQGRAEQGKQRGREERNPKVLTLSSVALYRAARPRSGKLGVVLKPFPRSSYVSRKPRTSAPALAPTPASTPPATASAEDRGGGDGDGAGAGAGSDSPPPRRPRPRFRPARRISSDSNTPPPPSTRQRSPSPAPSPSPSPSPAPSPSPSPAPSPSPSPAPSPLAAGDAGLDSADAQPHLQQQQQQQQPPPMGRGERAACPC